MANIMQCEKDSREQLAREIEGAYLGLDIAGDDGDG
jgi:hypothetical protein